VSPKSAARSPNGSRTYRPKGNPKTTNQSGEVASISSMHAEVVHLATVESLTEEIRGLVYERQTLRAVGAGAEQLERNRIDLVQRQQDLVGALIRRYLPADLDAA